MSEEHIRFRPTVELNGRTATGVEVPAAVLERLGALAEGRRTR